MAYSTNPYLAKARALALQLLVRNGLPVAIVANRCGVHRSTIWRWKRKWLVLNQHVQLTNDNRPGRSLGIVFRFAALKWQIPTESSRPRTCPHAVDSRTVARILELRHSLKRCAEVIWHAACQEGLRVSLSSVRRILRRHYCFDGARKPRVRYDNPRRPQVTRPGELVQTDTIHHVDPKSGRRLYYYTVIDLFTRMTFVTIVPRLGAGLAARTVLQAQRAWGFSISMVQSDNGPEYSHFFEGVMQRAGIQTRHSRLQRPNDNAHIERFNRTIQEECIGHYWNRSVPLQYQQAKLIAWLEYYNTRRVHLGIQIQTPIQMLQRS